MKVVCKIIDDIVKDMYNDIEKKTWENVDKLMLEIENFLKQIKDINNNQEIILNINEIINHLFNSLKNGDRTLTSDVLLYELKPIIQSFDS